MKIQKIAAAAAFFLMLCGFAVLPERAVAQDFAYDDEGNIVWDTNSTGNPYAGYHFHAVGWKFTVSQTVSGTTQKKTASIFLGKAFSKNAKYQKSNGIGIQSTGVYSCRYTLPLATLDEATGLTLERGKVKITVNAVIEFYLRAASGNCTSKHISTTKTDANKYCKEYSFASDFDGTYQGYFGQTVTQTHYALTVVNGKGISGVKVNGVALVSGKTRWFLASDTVKCTATAQSGYTFTKWSGDKTGSSRTITFRMPKKGLKLQANAKAPESGGSTGGSSNPPQGSEPSDPEPPDDDEDEDDGDVWDDGIPDEEEDLSPILTRSNFIVTLAEAHAGKVTEDSIFTHANAYDVEDGQIYPGIRADNSFVITDYDAQKITGCAANSVLAFTLCATDSAGNQTTKTIRIYVYDDENSFQYQRDVHLRFISEEYLNASPAKGGLARDSIWRSREYRQYLQRIWM